jgi:two-component system cell cycle sensor histidine kinase/response regulator CckA
VVEAADGAEALRFVERHAPFDLFVIDHIMPGLTGEALARQVRRNHPDARILYFTGAIDALFGERPRLWQHEAFVEKPVTMKGFLEAVSLLLFGHRHGPDSPPRARLEEQRPK